MASFWLELKKPVERIENIFVETYPTHRRPCTMMGRAHISNCRQGLMESFFGSHKAVWSGKLTQTRLVVDHLKSKDPGFTQLVLRNWFYETGFTKPVLPYRPHETGWIDGWCQNFRRRPSLNIVQAWLERKEKLLWTFFLQKMKIRNLIFF